MIDPTRHRQLQELNTVELCTEILSGAKNELYLEMHYLDVSLSSFGFEAAYGSGSIGTDGFVIYYQPEVLFSLYKRGRVLVNRALLHMLLHCLFNHPDGRGKRAEEYWNLACDLAVESIMDGLYLRSVHLRTKPYRMDLYQRLRGKLKVLNAEGIYRELQSMQLNEQQYQRMVEEFYVDNHAYWQLQDDAPKSSMDRQNQWNDNREKLQTEMEVSGNQEDESSKTLMEQVQVENRERYDYRTFLRKFSIWREEMQVDEDSFDFISYTYGLSMYGNMPLIEPLETKEVRRIEDFVIVIDTSMSCSGELVRRFLEETYDVLCESETYFRKINIHIIQSDEQVRTDHRITSREEMDDYMENFTIVGNGGTDFRPAFAYVNELMAKRQFAHLRGLLYFTDGQGIYPLKRPLYETAFIFVEDQYVDVSVPAWAMKLVLEPEQENQ